MSETLRDVRLFVAVYEELSFTAAAERENATQSGVSQHIRKIEDRFGVKLFARGGGSVQPTPAGESYYRHCIELLRLNEMANRSVGRFGAGLDGEMVVGLMPTMTRSVLAPALARFVDLHPNVGVRIWEAYSANLTQQVRAGELAFAIVPASTGTVGVRTTRFAFTPEVLVSGARAGREHMKPVRLADLGPLKVVVPSGQNARRANIETYLASNGVAVERRLELDAMMGTLDFVASTDWVAILPGLMMAEEAERARSSDLTGRFTVNPIADPALVMDLVLIEPARRPLGPVAAAFLDVLAQETARIGRVWGERAGLYAEVGAA
ncbi:LysR family transcriptional regulator [Ancylobacter sp. MQZ15Z-1]|uniref:LysR family transcriptional regulator n=1 Tax=Ancylobacter mangrovi TaxID=2972472 RepID=A0A9X2PJG1_9HYPH|nr:LysR family transcriptional regulator [Ancylobacter mangrovi]MCS0496292.1 LysR family transcriptional regulator [Ancylobacter mangrovi]